MYYPEYLPLCMAFRVIAADKSSGVCRAQGVAEVLSGLSLWQTHNTTLFVLAPQPQDPSLALLHGIICPGSDSVAVGLAERCLKTAQLPISLPTHIGVKFVMPAISYTAVHVPCHLVSRLHTLYPGCEAQAMLCDSGLSCCMAIAERMG